jgi:hypothetical protein
MTTEELTKRVLIQLRKTKYPLDLHDEHLIKTTVITTVAILNKEAEQAIRLPAVGRHHYSG